MQCPFCQVVLAHSIDGEEDVERCANPECWFHKMPKYSRYLRDEIVVTEKIIFPPNLYVVIEHLLNITTIWKLEAAIREDPIPIPQILCLDLGNMAETMKRLKLLVTFS